MKFNYKTIWRVFKYIILGAFIVKITSLFLKKDLRKITGNFGDFIKEEKREAKELVRGKESFGKYFKDSGEIFADFFIPTEGNGYKPKILRAKSLAMIAVVLLILKIFVASYLFFLFPNIARMSEMISQEVYDLVNVERAKNKLNALMINDNLNKAAEAKAGDMVKNNYFAHKSPDGKMPWDWIERNKYAYLYAGENLAMNFATAYAAHQALMFSESHKKNILNSRYSDIGIAVVRGKIDGKETNILVELFGNAQSSIQPALAAGEIREKTAREPVINKETSPYVLPSENIEITADSQDRDEAGVDYIAASAQEIRLANYQKPDFVNKLIYYSQSAFFAALIIITVLLLINIFIKISIQHKPVIIQTLLVIVLIIGLLSVRIHFLEGISQKVVIF